MNHEWFALLGLLTGPACFALYFLVVSCLQSFDKIIKLFRRNQNEKD